MTCPVTGPRGSSPITDEQIESVDVVDITAPDHPSDVLYGMSPVEIREYAIAVDPNWDGGRRYWRRVHRAARARCAAAYNARKETR